MHGWGLHDNPYCVCSCNLELSNSLPFPWERKKRRQQVAAGIPPAPAESVSYVRRGSSRDQQALRVAEPAFSGLDIWEGHQMMSPVDCGVCLDVHAGAYPKSCLWPRRASLADFLLIPQSGRFPGRPGNKCNQTAFPVQGPGILLCLSTKGMGAGPLTRKDSVRTNNLQKKVVVCLCFHPPWRRYL